MNGKKDFPFGMESFLNFQPKIWALWKAPLIHKNYISNYFGLASKRKKDDLCSVLTHPCFCEKDDALEYKQ